MISILCQVGAFFCFVIYASFFEWTLHKNFMHMPIWRYPFRAQAPVHHGLFRAAEQYFP
jgi:hypothetical protein